MQPKPNNWHSENEKLVEYDQPSDHPCDMDSKILLDYVVKCSWVEVFYRKSIDFWLETEFHHAPPIGSRR